MLAACCKNVPVWTVHGCLPKRTVSLVHLKFSITQLSGGAIGNTQKKRKRFWVLFVCFLNTNIADWSKLSIKSEELPTLKHLVHRAPIVATFCHYNNCFWFKEKCCIHCSEKHWSFCVFGVVSFCSVSGGFLFGFLVQITPRCHVLVLVFFFNFAIACVLVKCAGQPTGLNLLLFFSETETNWR